MPEIPRPEINPALDAREMDPYRIRIFARTCIDMANAPGHEETRMARARYAGDFYTSLGLLAVEDPAYFRVVTESFTGSEDVRDNLNASLLLTRFGAAVQRIEGDGSDNDDWLVAQWFHLLTHPDITVGQASRQHLERHLERDYQDTHVRDERYERLKLALTQTAV